MSADYDNRQNGTGRRSQGNRGRYGRTPNYHEANSESSYRAYRDQQWKNRYQVKKPAQGTWYEREGARGRGGNPDSTDRIDRDLVERERREEQRQYRSSERGQRQRAQGRDQRIQSDYVRRSARERGGKIKDDVPSDYARQQLERHAPTSKNYTSRHWEPPAVVTKAAERSPFAPNDPRPLYIRVAIVVVLLVILIVRGATFATGSELSSVNSDLDSAQQQLEQLNTSNSEMQSQLDSWQTTIDTYNNESSSSSSSSNSS
ncbi:MAG: hypothetical protein ACOX69_04055 [Coriobacteriales bacterium]|jgi:hypothetical protein